MGRRVLGHQPFDFSKNFWGGLLVLDRETGVELDTTRDVGKESRVGHHVREVQVGQNR
jgi:hypothetical protein